MDINEVKSMLDDLNEAEARVTELKDKLAHYVYLDANKSILEAYTAGLIKFNFPLTEWLKKELHKL